MAENLTKIQIPAKAPAKRGQVSSSRESQQRKRLHLKRLLSEEKEPAYRDKYREASPELSSNYAANLLGSYGKRGEVIVLNSESEHKFNSESEYEDDDSLIASSPLAHKSVDAGKEILIQSRTKNQPSVMMQAIIPVTDYRLGVTTRSATKKGPKQFSARRSGRKSVGGFDIIKLVNR